MYSNLKDIMVQVNISEEQLAKQIGITKQGLRNKLTIRTFVLILSTKYYFVNKKESSKLHFNSLLGYGHAYFVISQMQKNSDDK